MQACTILIEPQNESVLMAVGWDLLHTILPFVAVPDENCAECARCLLMRVAALCNPRELFSMVMESFVFFKVEPSDVVCNKPPCMCSVSSIC